MLHFVVDALEVVVCSAGGLAQHRLRRTVREHLLATTTFYFIVLATTCAHHIR